MTADSLRIRLEGLSLAFPLTGLQGRARNILKKGKLENTVGGDIEKKNSRIYVNALQNINLTVKQGDRIAITGHNGAGKSTLLRVVAGIYPPTSGTVYKEGSVAALLNPTAGMQLHATGYENIWVRGILQGMSNDQIEAAIPDIEEFTELGRYLGLPLARYSRGMRLRLAFAVATCQQPDIVLIDEWVNAGDKQFRDKARERLSSFVGSSGALLLATHSEKVIQTFCKTIIRMEHGRIGAFEDVLQTESQWD